MKRFIAAAFTVFTSLAALAQGYQPGQKVADFTLSDAGSNKNISLSNYKESRAVVVVFTNNFCPYAKLYENRLIETRKQYAGRGVQFLYINPTINVQEGAETVPDMAAKAKEWNYDFPYLADQGQKVSQQFGATKTPEVFVLQNTNGEFTLRYRGAIDDNPQLDSAVKERYLRNAIEAVLAGQSPKAVSSPPTGCLIKK